MDVVMDELEYLFTEVGSIELLEDRGWTTLYRCDACCALVVTSDRRPHLDWHERGQVRA